MIPGYDEWKTTLPEEAQPVMHCNSCDSPLYEGDSFYEIDGGICEECMKNTYKKIVEEKDYE